MASSNIKLFDENKGNMLTDTEFNISAQRLNGLQTGVASSQLQNKAMYQASLMAYAIAQVMMQNGLNANDTDAVSTFVANLSGTMLQKVYDIATTEEAKAGVVTGKWMSPALVKAAIDKTLSDNDFLKKSGGTMTGELTISKDGRQILLKGKDGAIFQDNNTTALSSYNKKDGELQNGYRSFCIRSKDYLNDPLYALVYECEGGIFDVLHTGNAQPLGFPKIAIGSYVGTGTYYSNNPNSLTFDFEPKVVIVVADGPNGLCAGFLIVRGQTYSNGIGSFSASSVALDLHITWSGTTVSWYTTNDFDAGKANAQMNTSGTTFRYVALG